MKEVLSIIGVLFLLFSIFVLEVWLKGDNSESKEVAQGAFGAVWVLIAFGFGSWAISWLFVNVLSIGDWTAKILHINFIFILLSPLILVFIMGLWSKRNAKRQGTRVDKG